MLNRGLSLSAHISTVITPCLRVYRLHSPQYPGMNVWCGSTSPFRMFSVFRNTSPGDGNSVCGVGGRSHRFPTTQGRGEGYQHNLIHHHAIHNFSYPLTMTIQTQPERGTLRNHQRKHAPTDTRYNCKSCWFPELCGQGKAHRSSVMSSAPSPASGVIF